MLIVNFLAKITMLILAILYVAVHMMYNTHTFSITDCKFLGKNNYADCKFLGKNNYADCKFLGKNNYADCKFLSQK